MAAFNDLLKRVADATLRGQLEEEYKRAFRNKKFGLVFEDHRPEFTSLYGVELKTGMTAVENGVKNADVLQVLSIAGGVASCYNAAKNAMESHPVADLVAVAKFEDPIFPVLTPVDEIENAPGDPLWHTLIQADNYHALQLLEYMYRGKVDCIYIDPPYNTGARDWKYNNDYVDENDAWRHSKWLSMMEKRLRLAKVLLNPSTGVLAVTIDEHEMHHLRMLLERIFQDDHLQVITDVINYKGVSQDHFARVEEYVMYVFMPRARISSCRDKMLGEMSVERRGEVVWASLLRRGNHSKRTERPNTYYPILIDESKRMIVRAGEMLPAGEHPVYGQKIEGYSAAWPVRTDLSEGTWGMQPSTLNDMISRGYVKLGEYDSNRQTWAIKYLFKKQRAQIDSGEIEIIGRDPVTGVVDVRYVGNKNELVRSVWYRDLHNAGTYGTDLIAKVIGSDNTFSFPKSLYAEKDAIGMVVKDNPNALIVDFFAGSGTTLHAVNLLNAEDGGKRRCIMVTNNEVSEAEAKKLTEDGHKPGDDAWESLGIAKHVTWPRTKCSILGQNVSGAPLTGEYQTNVPCEKKLPRTYYHLGFVKDFFGLSAEQKKKIVDMIGVPAGVKRLLKENRDFPDSAQKVMSGAAMPKGAIDADCRYVVSSESSASILFDETAVDDWLEALEETERVTDLYVVTESKAQFNEIKAKVDATLGDVVVASTKTFPMSEGFKANAKFFKLNFVDKDSVRLGRQFGGILPILWMRSGAKGKCPAWNRAGEPDMLVKPDNGFAVLVKYDKYSEFIASVNAEPKITDVYFVTNSESDYREMCLELKRGKKPTHLYHSYLENFVIGCRRNAK